MPETKHTPGPWTAAVDESGDNLKITAVDGTSVVGGCGCCGSPWTDEHHATTNAHLIAAAPDLLAALIKMLPENNLEEKHLRPGFETCERARVVIAKATKS